MRIDICVPYEEIRQASLLIQAIGGDETSQFGYLWLSANGSRRTWIASDEIKVIRLCAVTGDEEYSLGLPPTLIEYAAQTMHSAAEVTIELDGDVLTVGSPYAVCSASSCEVERPPFESVIPRDDEIGAWATIPARRLWAMLMAAHAPRVADEEDGRVFHSRLDIFEGRVACTTVSDHRGDAFISAAADDVVGSLGCDIDPRQVLDLLALFPPESDLRVGIPTFAHRPLVLRSDELDATVMPLRPPEAQIRESVEKVIREVCGRLAVERNAKGDYPLERRRAPMYARLQFQPRPATLQVFALLLTEIESSPELLSELNDLNAAMTYARLFHIEDAVMAQVDLAAATIDTHELETAIERIDEDARRVMPTLALVFGGEMVDEQLSERLAAYRSTVIEAEFVPGHAVTLNGPQATAEWSFDSPVHVVTGWNPQGVDMGPGHGDYINSQIAKDVIDRGGWCAPALGRSLSGDHSERSLVVWNIGRDHAVDIGRRANQDAIFEIDAESVTLVNCVDNTFETWPRVTASQ